MEIKEYVANDLSDEDEQQLPKSTPDIEDDDDDWDWDDDDDDDDD